MKTTIRDRFDRWRYRAAKGLAQYQRAWAYARNRMSEDTALQILYDCQGPAGSFCLISLDASDVLEGARCRWQDHPELPRLAREAAQRVAYKFEDYSETRSSCEDWAVDLVAEYAKSDGISLVRIDEIVDAAKPEIGAAQAAVNVKA